MKFRVGTAARLIAAAAILVGGLVHLQLYFDVHRNYPNQNLGRVFIANGVASVVIAAALVVRRDWFVRLAGIALVVGTLAVFAPQPDRHWNLRLDGDRTPSPQGIVVLSGRRHVSCPNGFGRCRRYLARISSADTIVAGRDLERRVCSISAIAVDREQLEGAQVLQDHRRS